MDRGGAGPHAGEQEAFEPVVLCLPADPRMARVARLTASALSSLAGFTIDDIDDLRIAVDEVVVSLIELGHGAELTLRFENPDGRLHVVGETSGPAGSSSDERFLLSERILAVVCDSHEVIEDDGFVRIAVVKRSSA